MTELPVVGAVFFLKGAEPAAATDTGPFRTETGSQSRGGVGRPSRTSSHVLVLLVAGALGVRLSLRHGADV